MRHWRRNAMLATLPVIRDKSVRTPWREFWRRFLRQHVAVIAGVFVLLLIAIAFLAPYLIPYDAETYFDYERLNEGPSAAHWLGVDSLGRDIFSRILMGTRISLAAGILSVLVGMIIGTTLGLVAGYYEGGRTGSSCAYAMCCLPSLVFCWRLPLWRLWAVGWRM